MKNTFKIRRELNKILITAQMPDVEIFFKNLACDRYDSFGSATSIGARYFYNVSHLRQIFSAPEDCPLHPNVNYPDHDHFIMDRTLYCNFLTAVGLSDEKTYTYKGIYHDKELKLAVDIIKSMVKYIVDSSRPMELNFEVENVVTPLVETI